jgi:hypothetical protein
VLIRSNKKHGEPARNLKFRLRAHQKVPIASIPPRIDRRADHRKAWADAFGYMAIAYEEPPVRRSANRGQPRVGRQRLSDRMT